MAIVISPDPSDAGEWADALTALLPDDKIWRWPTVGDRAEVEFVAMWVMPLEELATFTNLKAVLLLSAGANHLRPLDSLPDVPIVRLADPEVARDMAAWAIYWLLHFHRDMDRYDAQQGDQHWQRHLYKRTETVTVGIMGMGTIGTHTGAMVRQLGYRVIGWSRSGRPVEDYEMFGADRRLDFMAQVDFVINVLPLTPETRRIIDADALGAMRPGSVVINMGRGGTIDDDALFAALNSGHLRGAALDVVRGEPLDADAPYWSQRNLSITPHVSGTTFVASAAKVVAANIERIRRGETPFPLLDRTRGY